MSMTQLKELSSLAAALKNLRYVFAYGGYTAYTDQPHYSFQNLPMMRLMKTVKFRI